MSGGHPEPRPAFAAAKANPSSTRQGLEQIRAPGLFLLPGEAARAHRGIVPTRPGQAGPGADSRPGLFLLPGEAARAHRGIVPTRSGFSPAGGASRPGKRKSPRLKRRGAAFCRVISAPVRSAARCSLCRYVSRGIPPHPRRRRTGRSGGTFSG